MDYQTPPVEALKNLTITGNTNTSIKPNSNPSRQESYKRAYLTALLTQWYKPQGTRMNQSEFRTFETSAKRTKIARKTCNVVEYNVIGERITRLLSNMMEDQPECRDKLELVNRYVQHRENPEDVFSIIKSLY